MKAALIVLSGDAKNARDWLEKKYPAATIEVVSRYDLEKANGVERLRAVRRIGADVLAIVTERLEWQRGQNALLLFGALAGARQVLLIDSYGANRQESAAGILARLPGRGTSEAFNSAMAVN